MKLSGDYALFVFSGTGSEVQPIVTRLASNDLAPNSTWGIRKVFEAGTTAAALAVAADDRVIVVGRTTGGKTIVRRLWP
jgi:hypothetical protein